MLTAAARYSELLVEPLPGADAKARSSAERLATLVRCVQSEAWERWVGGLSGLPPARDRRSVINTLGYQRDIMHAARDLKYPRGVYRTYQIQAAYLDAVRREAILDWVTGRVGRSALIYLEAHRYGIMAHYEKRTRI